MTNTFGRWLLSVGTAAVATAILYERTIGLAHFPETDAMRGLAAAEVVYGVFICVCVQLGLCVLAFVRRRTRQRSLRSGLRSVV